MPRRKKKAEGLDPQTRVYLNEIVALTAKGKTPEQIARETDLDPTFVGQIMSLTQFEEELKAVAPDAHAIWREARAEEHARARVRTMARQDAPEIYKMMMDLLRSSKELRDVERCAIGEKLLRLGGIKDDAETEIVKLSDAHVTNWFDAMKEMDQEPEDWATPYDG